MTARISQLVTFKLQFPFKVIQQKNMEFPIKQAETLVFCLWCFMELYSSLQTKAVHWFICFPSSHCSWQLLKSYLISLNALKTNYITEWFNFVLIVMENGLLAIHAAYKDLQVFICLLLRRIYHDKLPSEFKKVRVLSFDNQTINSFKLSR